VTHILDDLRWRGLIQDSTDPDEMRRALDAGPVTFYVGFDPTGPSLHIGHLVQTLTARRLQLAGHRPLLLVGGSTGLVGDPSGKSAERVLNSVETVTEWVRRLRAQLEPFYDFDGPNAATMVNNLDWTGPLSVLEFLRDVGKHFPVNQMLARDVVRNRLESGISYTEFSYQILQSLDYYELNRRHECVLQQGGADQWGNLTAGLDFLRRKGVTGCHAFTTPLITRADGTKFGKTADGAAVWLDPGMTSPYAFYQFWYNVSDSDAIHYLKVFSFRSREEIEELARATEERPAARAAQKALAEELTALLHGEDELAKVVAASQALFGRGELAELDEATLGAALREAGLTEVKRPLPTIARLLADTGLVGSLSEARRVVREGGAYVDNRKVGDGEVAPDQADLLHGRYLVLRRGKRTVAGVEITSG
jgi:tyrosyl-tRNA synthetase